MLTCEVAIHDDTDHDMEILLITGHLCGESLGYWWIP